VSTFIDGSLDPARALYLLTMQDICYRGMADSWPKARWIKFRADGDHVFIMVWMNRACSETFYAHVDPRRCIGHCDRVCWDDGHSARYAETDELAVERAGEVIETFEPVQGNGEIRVHKFAYRIDNEQLRGWCVYGECPD
jgi:hypothetical protein